MQCFNLDNSSTCLETGHPSKRSTLKELQLIVQWLLCGTDQNGQKLGIPKDLVAQSMTYCMTAKTTVLLLEETFSFLDKQTALVF